MEALPVIAFSLGCNTFDASFCYGYVFVHRLSSTSANIADQTQSVKKTLTCAALILVRSCLMPILIFTITYGAVFPASDMAAGGNYNLHFLSAHFRRDLIPDSRLINSSFFDHPVPLYSLRPSTPMSLYLPQAGFLWSDHLVWNQDYGVFDTLPAYEKDIKRARPDIGTEPQPAS
ncbi:hypothetical protein MGYG_05007 [Nannizzia gypsea CBS 118893]|uniref:Uncharacterized protein n=1 Tax=Arthroderma gypseum (strain ATCC MYA-4604 / CBS 118893) TaxID=535722 RepID=E4UY11_ARTGP|nr:hypothetical protein MGYG_05007 [Nannizzia gypsea CBS 118893]EFR02004.1 hypothetical protein MGYG_05007 [Nannizzia gypsea CBS 118893]